MGRGAQAQTQQMIDQQLSQQNAQNQQIYGSSQALGSQAAGGFQNMLANPGYSQAQQSAISNLSQSALSSSFNALAQNAANRAARTRNSAGYGELISSLARKDKIRPASRSKTSWPLPTPRARIRAQPSPDSAASMARTRACSVARWEFPRNCSMPERATPPPADSAWDSAPAAFPSA